MGFRERARLAFYRPTDNPVQRSDCREIFLERSVNTGVVSGGEDIEQQPASHRDTEARQRACLLLREFVVVEETQRDVDPGVDDAIEEGDGIWAALKRLPVQLEEEPFARRECRRSQRLP